MRSRLLQSFLFVLGFWWVAAALYWSLSDPTVNLEGLRRVVAVFPWVHIQVPDQVTVLDAWGLQKAVLKYWSGPVMILTLLIAALGAGAVWAFALRKQRERADRIDNPDEYRGVGLSLGVLPSPQTPKIQPVALRATDTILGSIAENHRAVLADALGMLAGNRDVFAGHNQPAGSLLQQTLKATYKALRETDHPGLLAITVAAGELGKITAWKKDEDGAWVRTRIEERESARLLAALPSWWALPITERLATLYAVKHRGNVANLPEVPGDPAVYRLARSLLERPKEASVASVSVEAQVKAYEQRDPEVELFELFEREVAMFPFQTMGLPKNIPAVGWKRGRRAFLLENRLKESLLPKLRPELQSLFAAPAEKMRVEPFTAAMLKIFHAQGWLVLENGPTKVTVGEALWVIQAGKLEFTRAIILDLPDSILARLPSKDSAYEMSVKRPVFQSPIATASVISKDDLMGGMLRPKTPRAESTEKAAPAAPPAG